ncbi:hypothetical protein F4604DRAFT_1677282 [Suillus subluteus]|nr:hypothetical protein F4604DRAFT_1677282 [Suillus subluteus]
MAVGMVISCNKLLVSTSRMEENLRKTCSITIQALWPAICCGLSGDTWTSASMAGTHQCCNVSPACFPVIAKCTDSITKLAIYGSHESNKLVAGLFSLTWKVQPAIIFVDEINSFLRERHGDDHKVMGMMKAEFMT